MASKSDKEKKPAAKANPVDGKESSKKPASKSKKEMDEDDEDEDLTGETNGEETPVGKKTGKAGAKKSSGDDDDEDDVAAEELDDWEKPEEEEEWDPDFEEFDIPKSKGKKTGVGGKKAGEEEDFKFEDDEFKDLFNEKDYDDDEEDDY